MRFRYHLAFSTTSTRKVVFRLARATAGIAAVTLVAGGCDARVDRGHPAAVSASAHDDFGRPIPSGVIPRRVVSLNPTTTEFIFAIGAESQLIGRSHWDAWPEAAKRLTDMGDAVRPNVERVIAARPNLVLLYASEDNRPASDRLERAGIHTLSLRIDRVADFDRAARLIARVLGDSARGAVVADTVAASLARVRAATRDLPHPTVVWPLEDRSTMVAGGATFMSDLIDAAGASNIYASIPQPSPVVSIEDIVTKNPDLVIRGGEAGSSTTMRGVWQAVPAVKQNHVVVIPYDLVLRPSVQMGMTAALLARAIHPGLPLQ